MATGTRNKRTTAQEMRAKLNARVNQQADHLAALDNHVKSIAEAKLGAAEEIEELKLLGLTLTDIEDATDISVHRLSTFTRQARKFSESTEDDGALDDSDEDDLGVARPEGQEDDEGANPQTVDAVGDPGTAESELAG